MDVIDLTAARAQRAEDAARAEAAADSLYTLAEQVARARAAICWRVSQLVWDGNREFALDIERTQCRRAKADFRVPLRKQGMASEAVNRLVEHVARVFWMTLDNLRRERDVALGRNPNALEDETFKRLHRPWPSIFVLTSEAAISWIDMIERTGPRLKPSTKAELSLARSELALGHILNSNTEARINRLIKARWLQGHTMGWESKWPALMAEAESA